MRPKTTTTIIACLLLMLVTGCPQKAPPTTKAGSTRPKLAKNSGLALNTNAIRLPIRPHWQVKHSPKFDRVYFGDPGDVYYTKLHRRAFAIADLSDIDALRDHYRDLTKSENGGIISVETMQVQGLNAVVCYSKQIVPNIRGYRYVARCVIPCGEQWFEIRMDAISMSMVTGGRETAATLRLGKDLEYEDIPADAAIAQTAPGGKANGKRIKGYYKDPYDSKFDSAAMNSLADDKELDKAFPKHPLSRIRNRFPTLLDELQIDASIRNQ